MPDSVKMLRRHPQAVIEQVWGKKADVQRCCRGT